MTCAKSQQLEAEPRIAARAPDFQSFILTSEWPSLPVHPFDISGSQCQGIPVPVSGLILTAVGPWGADIPSDTISWFRRGCSSCAIKPSSTFSTGDRQTWEAERTQRCSRHCGSNTEAGRADRARQPAKQWAHSFPWGLRH